jgi:hypothetical protein
MHHVCSDRLTAWFGCGVEKKTLKPMSKIGSFFLVLSLGWTIIELLLSSGTEPRGFIKCLLLKEKRGDIKEKTGCL